MQQSQTKDKPTHQDQQKLQMTAVVGLVTSVLHMTLGHVTYTLHTPSTSMQRVPTFITLPIHTPFNLLIGLLYHLFTISLSTHKCTLNTCVKYFVRYLFSHLWFLQEHHTRYEPIDTPDMSLYIPLALQCKGFPHSLYSEYNSLK